MKNSRDLDSAKLDVPESEALPTLIKHISSNEVAGFDSIGCNSCLNNQNQPSDFQPFYSSAMLTEALALEHHTDESEPINHQRNHSISISTPVPPVGNSLKNTKNNSEPVFLNGIPDSKTIGSIRPNTIKFCSQTMSKGCASEEPVDIQNFPNHPTTKGLKDKRCNSFKTSSGKLERQISHLCGKPREASRENSAGRKQEKEALPADRYFNALEGPELETHRASEEIVLPENRTWPFLLRFPVSSFGICLGVSSQAILWKTLAISASKKFLHISLNVNFVLWWISIALVTIVGSIYLLKVVLYFEAVRQEYYHPIRINYFFAPWIALLFLAIGVPPSVTKNLHAALWYILMIPFLCLELKIYGQWMSGGQRRLSKVVNPSNHLSVVGNFIGALLGASMGLQEGPIFFFAIGLAHYTVLFVTLYQQLPTNETLPKKLHPVFFLFVAAPSVASMAWAKIEGSFNYGSRIAYFIALFLYFSLAVRVNFFRGFKFSLAWWAYTFPMTGAAIVTIKYSNEVRNVVTQALAILLSAASILIVTALLVTTIVHAFVLQDLFPNDIDIDISNRKPRHHHNLNNEIENNLKHARSDSKDIEASVDTPRLDTNN